MLFKLSKLLMPTQSNFSEVDGFNFLLDCGWDENFNVDFVKENHRSFQQ